MALPTRPSPRKCNWDSAGLCSERVDAGKGVEMPPLRSILTSIQDEEFVTAMSNRIGHDAECALFLLVFAHHHT
eukprot:6459872-Prorocentrum_lima.AAC.1